MTTIFIAGIHGVGKTHLAKPAAERLEIKYATASQLIREERGRASWNTTKLVDEVDQNQSALVAAVRQIKIQSSRLLLDGHFVLRAAPYKHVCLPDAVFRDIDCTSVVLLTCPSQVVLERLVDRGDNSWDEVEVISFAHAEATNATFVCAAIGVPLITLDVPTATEFETVLAGLARK
jgi:adenylate kinase